VAAPAPAPKGPAPLSQALAGGINLPAVNLPAVNLPGGNDSYYIAGQPQPGTAPATSPAGPTIGVLPMSIQGGGVGPKPPDQNTPDPISWAFDMLSRPMRAVENSVAATNNSIVDAVKLWRDGGPGTSKPQVADAKAILGDAGEMVSAPFRGLFSTNAEDQKAGAEHIEQAVDKWGELDPNYKNVKDNVNPWVKGILGFGADVALDPLTYVPGPDILKGVKAAADGVGAVVKTVKGGGGGIAALKAAGMGAARTGRELGGEMLVDPAVKGVKKLSSVLIKKPDLEQRVVADVQKKIDEGGPDAALATAVDTGAKDIKGVIKDEVKDKSRVAANDGIALGYTTVNAPAAPADPLPGAAGAAAAADGAKAVLSGAVAAKDAAPGSLDVAKLADKAVGGDPKAASLLDTLTTGASTDAQRAATPVEPPVTKVSAPAAPVLNTTTRDLTTTAAPEVSAPLTEAGQAAVVTGTDTPLGAARPLWTADHEAKFVRAQKRLDGMAPGASADKLQAQVEAMAAEKAAAHTPVAAPEPKNLAADLAKPAEARVAEPVARDVAPAVPAALSATMAKPMMEQLRASKTAANFERVYAGVSKLAAAKNVSMLDALTKAKEQDQIKALLGDQFLAGIKSYGNGKRFDQMLTKTHEILTASGHLDDGDFGTKLSGAQTMLTNLMIDAGVSKKAIQTARVAFESRSSVAQGVTLEGSLARMGGGPRTSAGLVKHLQDNDLKTLVKDGLDNLRENKPGMTRRTKGGAMSTGGPLSKSFAEYRTRFGTNNQAITLKDATNLSVKQLSELEGYFGAKRSSAIRQMVLGDGVKSGLLDGFTTILDKHGAAFFLEDGQKRYIPMAFEQALQILGGDPQGARLLEKLLFNGGVKKADGEWLMSGTPASKTALAEAVVGAAKGDSREQILATLKNDAKRYREGTQPNFLSRGSELGNVDFRLPTRERPLPAGPGEILDNKYDQNGKITGVYTKQSADSLAEQTADLIVARRADLIAQARENEAAYAQRTARETRDMTSAVLAQLDALRNDPAHLQDAIAAFAHPKKLIEAVGDQAGAREDSKALTEVAVEAASPEPDVVVAQQAVKAADAVQRGDLAAAKAASQVASDAAAKPIEDAYGATLAQGIQDGSVPDIAGIGDKLPPVAGETPIGQPPVPPEEVFTGGTFSSKTMSADQRMVASEVAIHGRITGRAFAKFPSSLGFINKATDMVMNGAFSFESLDTEMRGQLSELANRYGASLLQLQKLDAQVTSKLKISDIVRLDAFAGRASAPEYAEQRKITDEILSAWMSVGNRADPKSMLAETFLRAGASPEAIIKHLKSSGIIPEDFKFNDEELKNLIEGDRHQYGSFAGSLANLLMQKGLRIPDSYDFYTKMFGATATYATHAGIAEDLRATGLKMGFLSEVPTPTMRRVEVTNDSIFAHFINAKPLYATPEMHGAILRMSDLLNPKSHASGEVAKLLQVFDDTQQLWKWLTVAVRPGTRMHNYVSDHLMTWMAMGSGWLAKDFRSAYAKSLKVLSVNKPSHIPMSDLIQAIQHVGGTEADRAFGGAGEKIISGKYGEFDNPSVWKLFHDKSGLGVSAKAIERTDKENLSVVGQLAQRGAYNTKVGQLASKTTEWTENQVRMTHYLMGLQRAADTGYVVTRWGKKVWVVGKDGKLDPELLGHALGDSVRRYHPDPHMLTNFERNTIRRVLPFYSWNRGAVPAILDAMFMHPGRGLALNKLSYNVGVGFGINGNNEADPFPNGMWPGFLTSQAQGPQVNINGSMFMANPGIPTWDVANMFTDPNNVSGSISPLIAGPYTALSGTDFRTGQPITNRFDALDQQIPLISNYEAASGNSVTGSLVGALTGAGPQKTSAGAQQQIEPGQFGLGVANYMLGGQVSHVNKASYLQAGIAQQKQRLSQMLTGQSPPVGTIG
jgi:hypothetical protein